MKMKKLLILMFSFCFIFLQSCKKDVNSDLTLSNPKLFTEYIASFTTGVVSTKAPIDIGLTKNIGDWEANQEVDSKLFTITPAVKGKLIYLPTNVLRFEPTERLKQDQKYAVSLKLGEIVKLEDKLSEFNFQFNTIPLTFNVEFNDLQSVDTDNFIVNGVLSSSDWVTTEQAKKVITAKLKNNEKVELQLTSEAKSEAKEFPFIAKKITAQDQSTELVLSINGKSLNTNQNTDFTFSIPPNHAFYPFFIKTFPNDDQSVWINFSKPLRKNQSFEGLISLSDNNSKLTYTTDGNVLKVYVDKPIKNEVTLTVHRGIRGLDGTSNITSDLEHYFTVNFGILSPQIELLSNGTILPSSQNLKINFQATTLNAVDVKVYRIFENNILQFLQDNSLNGSYNLHNVASPIAETTIKLTNANPKALLNWNTYALDLASIITPEPGAIYRVELSMKKVYSLYTCGEESTEDNSDSNEQYATDYSDEYDEYDDYEYYYYNWSERDNPCDPAYYYYQGKKAINVLASDLGVIIKGGTNNVYSAIVTDLISTEPIGAATVEFYTYQQQLIASSKTDSYGLLSINLEKQKPSFAIVRHEKNTTYVKIEENNALAISNFDVDGTKLNNGINGYLYTERGVWRPGDDIFISFILDDTANPLPSQHPIKLTFSDPYGKLVDQIIRKKNNTNHYVFQLKTSAEAPTGNWSANLSVGGVKFYKRIKIETIKPNRLKIKNNVEGKVLSSTTSKRVDFNVQWLQGTTAKNLKANVTMKLIKQPTAFKKFKNYTFENNLYSDYSQDNTVFNGSTDYDGNFSFYLDSDYSFKNAGLLKAIFVTKVFENGGDMSTDVSTATYSPFSSYVGILSPDPNKYGYYETDQKLKFSFVKLNDQEETLQGRIKIDIYKNSGSWWWSRGNNGYSDYSTSSYYSLYLSETIETNSNGLGEYTLTIPEQDWGTYEVVATDLSSGHISATTIYVDWPYYSTRAKGSQAKEATMLSIATDKKEYSVGEKVKLSFPSSENGRALVSIENGTNVVETHWVKTTKGETNFEFTATANMAPNIYINISSIQPHANTLNNSPIRLYGIVPIDVYDKKTKLEPIITMPDRLQPEADFSIQVKEKSGQKMTYTIAVVEEGLLDLTRFKTPNPWDNFYSKTALGVRTWDIYNDVIGAYGGSINQIFSIGGDEDLGAGEVKKANRFKPVVIHEGPFILEAGKTANHKLKMPKYIGSVRTMIVAANANTKAYGNVEKTVKVNNPLMILGSLPRRAVPGEKVTLPVTVFAMEKQIKDVKVTVKTDDKFKLLTESSQNITFSSPGDQIVYFDLEVLQKTGVSKILIEATSGKEKANYEVELDVLNPNPIATQNHTITIHPNQTEKINWENFGVSGTNTAVLELSNFPGINLTSRLKFLINYPHGCSEQITSGVFPQLFLEDFTELNDSKKKSIQNNVNAGIVKLAERQMSNGGFRYWSSSTYADDWATSYVGHFFLEAEKRGYVLPVGSKANWISYQQNEARNWRHQPNYNNDVAQSYRLYTLALAGAPELASMNRLRETANISQIAKLRLAAAYALVGQKEIATKLATEGSLDNRDNNYFYYGSYERNMAMALETLILTNSDATRTYELATELAHKLGSDTWMSTQTTAYGLNAISQYTKKLAKSNGIKATYSLNGQSATVNDKNNFFNKDLTSLKTNNELSLTNTSNGVLYVKVATSGILPIGKELVDESKLSIKTTFTDTKGMTIDPTTLNQGTEFIAYITITNNDIKSVDNIALTHIVPSGWEIVNLRYTEAGDSDNQVSHTDIRDDRSMFYFYLSGKSSKVLKVNLNASYLGKYYMPGVHANAMYDNSYRSRTAGKWIEVVK
ncbi:hypothetical protein GJV76_01730 [Myroides sp. BIT-d1]|uniref:Alpha-2-macroglobulin domain protein n=1 Tax=Myroides albus TaxID=2562892 RepID=A0A6I3LLM0_9FLAO|nr:MG2 domain-containing protein [Myroides albus]MTG96875.1 hypothetical protein [Myroides albus]